MVYLFSQYNGYHRREKSIEKRITILLIKNYELRVKEDDEEEEGTLATGKRITHEDEDKDANLAEYNEAM